jgi:hypothetical protein
VLFGGNSWRVDPGLPQPGPGDVPASQSMSAYVGLYSRPLTACDLVGAPDLAARCDLIKL